jgi:bifunctional UDP-N-acetylglucosamine pyrophosphorylase/glucosamine-1-phosphate N-acetyltransferase
MQKRKISAIVLAAGKGVRMKSSKPKVLSLICGKSLLEMVIDNLLEVKSFEEIILVLNKDLLFLTKSLKKKSKKIRITIQQKPLGTADAAKQGIAKLSKNISDVFIISADVVLFSPDNIEKLISSHIQSGRVASLVSGFSDSPYGYGRIIRNKAGQVERITEEIDLTDKEKQIAEINSGIYCFKKDELRKALKSVTRRPNKNEFYLTDCIQILSAREFEGEERIESICVDHVEDVLGINSAVELAKAQKILSLKIINEFLNLGVKIIDPQTTYIEADVEINQDCIIYPFTYIEAGVKIGNNCSIGPFARLRKGVRLGNNITVGNFIELSRTRVGNGTIMKHFGYFGDCIIGQNANIGAGTVTANYDGQNKFITNIADGAFIGCDTVLIAPVRVGKKAVTGAGAVLTKNKNVPDGKVALGLPARITNKKRRASKFINKRG